MSPQVTSKNNLRAAPKMSRREIPSELFSWQGNELLHQLYAARGISNADELNMGLDKLLPYHSLSNIQLAVDLIFEVMKSAERIIIVGDFDVDGATSTCLMMEVFRAFGHQNIDYLVPNRFDFGYGLSPEIVEVAAESKPDLVITVDNGIANIAGVEKANALGIKVIITDHHLPPDVLPDAAAIVNPNLVDDQFPSKNLAGVGVAFYLLLALRAKLKQENWFELQKIPVPNLANWLDLVAVGTVADMVPLDLNNRRLVEQGLRRIRAGQCRSGIRMLLELSKRNIARLTAIDIGFVIGPRLNAAGRLDDISVGIQCLMASEPSTAKRLAVELDELNLARREIEADMQAEALAQVSLLVNDLGAKQLPLAFCLFKEHWHQGVVGLVASRIKEHFHRPVFAFARENEQDKNNTNLKGSGRSVAGVHIRDALVWVDTHHPQLMTKFGGHAMAAGLTLSEHHLTDFEKALNCAINIQLGDNTLTHEIVTDGALDDKWLNLGAAQTLSTAGPWGQHFPEPSFDGHFQVVDKRIVGLKHLKLVLQTATGQLVDGIAFNIDPEFWSGSIERVKIVYKPEVNEFRGETSLQLMIKHIEPQ